MSWAACVVARGVIGQELQVGPELAGWAHREHAARISPSLAFREAQDATGSPALYPYQRAGAGFLYTAGSALMADEMGTGKSAQTIHALELAGSYPALIICPNSVKATWEREFARWAPHRVVKVAGNGTVAATKAVQEVANGLGDVLVVNWEALRSLSRLAPYGSVRLEPCRECDPTSTRAPHLCQRENKVLNLTRWATVVADEAHRMKDPKAAQTRAAWALGDRAERRIALTGTPIANSPEDLWSVMRFVDPQEYPGKTAFVERYVLTQPNLWSGFSEAVSFKPERREELDKFFLPRFIRRTKAEVLPHLPPKVYIRRDVPFAGKQLQAYKSLASEMVAAIEGGTIVARNALIASLRLRQLASAYGTVTSTTGDGDPIALVDQQVQLSEPSSKLDVLEEVLMELGERQAVIFAESKQLINLAAARLEKTKATYGLITGDIPTQERAAYMDKFQAGDIRYLLITTGAGGEGITLTAADTAIFLQRPWSAVQNAQAEDRLHRVGQTAQSVTYIDLVTAGTIEERVFEALQKKEAKLQDVVRDELGGTDDTP